MTGRDFDESLIKQLAALRVGCQTVASRWQDMFEGRKPDPLAINGDAGPKQAGTAHANPPHTGCHSVRFALLRRAGPRAARTLATL
jgi:hypothetical protein